MTRAERRELGMDRKIPRRDFLNGVALGAAGLLAAPRWLAGPGLERASAAAGSAYPPALTGLRGSHEGSYEVAHAVRDGSFAALGQPPVETGEEYDLVVVGGGLSGLAAAYFFAKTSRGSARTLILDNHDDFGGHATRNEFHQLGRELIGYGGTYAIESAGPWSAVAKALVFDLGVDVSRWERVYQPQTLTSRGLRPGFFFGREVFGADRLLAWPSADGDEVPPAPATGPDPWATFLEQAPLSPDARRDLFRLYREKGGDYFPGESSDAKKQRLARVSYAEFLTRILGLHADVVRFFQAHPLSLYGTGIDAVPAQDAWALGWPGFDGLKLEPGPGPGMNLDAYPYGETEPYFFHFPDGNASLARLLVRRLVPEAVPGRTAEDVVTAHVDYSRLDRPGSPVRIRLGSTVVRVAHRGEVGAAREVDVSYARGERVARVRGKRVILACWNGVIPYICPELPEPQKQALAYGVKVPRLRTNVLVRSWTAFEKLGISEVRAPGSYHHELGLDLPVSLGGYRFPVDPAEPTLVTLSRTPCAPGLAARDQHIAGRLELLETRFEAYEREIRDQLARTLGAGGFDPARDIAAITVNRWPHGYAYQYNSLFDPFWLENGELPCVVGRRPFGLVAIANSDAAAYAYTDAAIDQAFRAVQEILPRRG